MSKKDVYVYIQTNKLKHGKKYYIKLEKRVNGKRVTRYYSKSFDSKLKARNEVSKIYTDIERGNFRVSLKNWNIAYYLDYYCDTIGDIKNWSKNTYRSNSYYANELLEFCNNTGLKYLRDIKQNHLERYIQGLSNKDLKVNSINHRIIFVKAIFAKAVKLELIYKSPASFLEKLKVNDKQDTIPFSDKELKLIIDYSKINNTSFYNIFMCGIYTGLRRNEICKLEWQDIDLMQDKIIISASKTKAKYERIIPLHIELKKVLLSLSKSDKDNYVFRYSNGDNVKADWITKTFTKIRNALNLPKALRFHSTRATFITKAMASTFDTSSVQEIIGHKDLKTTQGYIKSNFKNKQSIINGILYG